MPGWDIQGTGTANPFEPVSHLNGAHPDDENNPSTATSSVPTLQREQERGRTYPPPSDWETHQVAARASRSFENDLASHSNEIDELRRLFVNLRENLVDGLHGVNEHVAALSEQLDHHAQSRVAQRSETDHHKIDNDPDVPANDKYDELVGIIKGLREEIAELKHNKSGGSQHSPGKEKVLASSIKNMFKGMGLLTAASLAVVGGLGLLTAICTGQFYAIVPLGIMGAAGYFGVSGIVASESVENSHGETKSA